MGWNWMGASPQAITKKVYLDENGNPIKSQGKVYLDDAGNPKAASTSQPESTQPFLLRGLVSPETMRTALFERFPGSDEQGITQDEIERARDAEIAKGESPWKAGALEFSRGVRKSAGDIASSLTSPAGIATLVATPFRAGRLAAGALGVGLGGSQLGRRQEGESLPDVVERNLYGLSGVVGGAAGAASALAPKTLNLPVKTAVEHPLGVLQKGAGEAVATTREMLANRPRPLTNAALKLAKVDIDTLKNTQAMPQQVMETQASLAAEKAKMRAYAKEQFVPVDKAVGAIDIDLPTLAEISRYVPAKTLTEITEGVPTNRLSFTQVQELKSALHRIAARSTDPIQQAKAANLRDGLIARLQAEAQRAGVQPEFTNANATWKQYAQDWLESPLADALDATNPTDIVRIFTGKEGESAVTLANKYQVDFEPVKDIIALGSPARTQMLADASDLQALGPRRFADTKLKEIGARPGTEFDRSLAVGGVAGTAVGSPLGPMALATFAARRSPAALRFAPVRNFLTRGLPEQFKQAPTEPYAPMVPSELVPDAPRGLLPRMGETSTPLSRGEGIPPPAPSTPEGRGLLLRANPQAITNAARDFSMNAPEGQLALPPPSSGPVTPPIGFNPFSTWTTRDAASLGRVPDFKDVRALAVPKSSIPQLPASSRRVLITPQGEVGPTAQIPSPSRLLPAGPEILSEAVTEKVPSPRRLLEAPKPAVPQGGSQAPKFASKERAGVANAPKPSPEQMKQTLATENAELKRRVLQKAAPEGEKAQALQRIKENEEMMTKFETKEGKKGVVDKEGKFSIQHPEVKEPEGGWKGRTVAWTDKGTRYEMVVDDVVKDKQGRTLLKGYDQGLRHVEAKSVKVKK